jgi:hypothetical protein
MRKMMIDVVLAVALAVLPLVVRRRTIHTICVIVVVLFQLGLIHFGLKLAARNIPLPSRETMSRQVRFADGWQEGRMGTQKIVDAYVLPLSLYTLALGALVLSAKMMKRKGMSQPPDAGGGQARA